MKIIELTSATLKTEDRQPQKVSLVIGPGLYFTNMEKNNATAISTAAGVILVLETVEQIAEAIKKES